tara:strand:+ start:204 stop:449 length:246 start_codon:yes stop_codon:yes gene_type:complete
MTTIKKPAKAATDIDDLININLVDQIKSEIQGTRDSIRAIIHLIADLTKDVPSPTIKFILTTTIVELQNVLWSDNEEDTIG